MLQINEIIFNDVRFPTSLTSDGSDAVHTDPNYSCLYVRIYVENHHQDLIGHGLTFTIGRGTEILLKTAETIKSLILNIDIENLFEKKGEWLKFLKILTNDSQLRWLGPEKGVIHLTISAIINAIWDLWAKFQRKPLWKLLIEMEPEKLIDFIDFQYITDAITKEEALDILNRNKPFKEKRLKILEKNGYPAYTTAVGWIGYDEEKRRQHCREAMKQGFTRFKVKVGSEHIEQDIERLRIVRNEIGSENLLMVDANQKWNVIEAIERMKQLSLFNLLWIEEPTSPDDILGHRMIRDKLQPLGIKIATGEQCHNRVMFKQFLSNGSLDFCQIDCCRLAGVNEVLSVVLMASKFQIPICPHAGGVGLCEYVQHLAIWDFICCSNGDTFDDNRMIEYIPHLQEFYNNPACCLNGNYLLPEKPGYGCHLKSIAFEMYDYPNGKYWKQQLQQQQMMK